jgi:transcriptional regulator with PAS, ATPase and Fis domain
MNAISYEQWVGGHETKSGRGSAAAPVAAPVIGESAAWRDALRRAAQVASTEATVLLQGDSGTGKEVLARVIHRASPRRDGPFVAINCAALPEALLESELFGYERGAFTGATQMKPGQIELASGGVLFLDEVSEMTSPAQAKFLRVLQEREFQRLGGTRPLKANIRVIAATNRELRQAVERGTFRADLYYRLQVFDIRLPALRDRRADIPLLTEAFLRDISRSLGRLPARVTPDAHAALFGYAWPGNVRELRNVLERAAILCEGGIITTEHLSLDPPSASASAASMAPRPAAAGQPATAAAAEAAGVARGQSITDLKAVERRTIEYVLRETDGNKAKAARLLGLSRSQLYVRLRRYDLDRPAA